jgi:hypothetical protein
LLVLEEVGDEEQVARAERETGRQLPSRDEAVADILRQGDWIARACLLAVLGPEGRAGLHQQIRASARALPADAEADLERRLLRRFRLRPGGGPRESTADSPHATDSGHAADGADAGDDADQLTERRTDNPAVSMVARALPDTEEDSPMASRVDMLAALARVPLLANLTTRQLWQLAAGAGEQSVAAGQPIVIEGNEEDGLWILLRGRARVERGPASAESGKSAAGRIHVCELGAGDFFGEIALFDSGPRSASVVALQPCRLLHLARQEVELAVEQVPGLALAMCRALSRRLRETTARLDARTA